MGVSDQDSGRELAPERIRVGLVDDDAMVRTLLSETLTDDVIEVVGTFGSGEEALESDIDVDLWLVDMRLPGINGRETIRRLRARDDDVHLIALSAFFDHPALDVLGAGAEACLSKDDPPARIRQAIRTVVDGLIVFSPSNLEHALRSVRGSDDLSEAVRDNVDSRIVVLLGAGESYEQIASDVGMSVSGTKKRAARIMSAMGVTSRAQLVAKVFGLRG